MKILNGINVTGDASFNTRPTVNSDGVVLLSELDTSVGELEVKITENATAISELEEVVASLDLGVKYRIVSSKEEMTEKGYIYLLPHEDSGYSEWMLVEDESGADVLEEIGDTRIDLTDYYTKEETYSQKELDDKLDAIVADEHADLENYYTKSEIDTTLADYATKEEVSSTIDAETSARESADTSLQSAIDSVSSSLSNYATTSDLDSTKSALQSSIDSVDSKADKNAEDIASIQSTYLTKDDAGTTYATITSLSDVDSKVDKNAKDIKALQDAGYLTEAKAEETYAKITDVAETYLSKEDAGTTYATITALTGVETDLATETSTRESAISSVESELASTKSELETSISAVDTKADNNATAITAEETARKNADSDLESKISSETSARESADTALQTAIDNVSSSLSNYATTDTLNSTKSELETSISSVDSKATQNATDIANETSARESADKDLEDKISAVETSLLDYATTQSVSELSKTVDTNTAGIETNKEAIDALQSSLSSNYYTKSEVADTYATIKNLSTVEEELKAEISQLDLGVKYEVVSSKEEMTETGYIYLLKKESGEGYSEWMLVDTESGEKLEEIGDTDIDLTDYYTKSEVNGKIDEILVEEKTDLQNYYTKSEVDTALGDYAKTAELEAVETTATSALTEAQSASEKATENATAISNLQTQLTTDETAIQANSTAISDLQSASANYVDLTSTQTIAGQKTFSRFIQANGGVYTSIVDAVSGTLLLNGGESQTDSTIILQPYEDGKGGTVDINANSLTISTTDNSTATLNGEQIATISDLDNYATTEALTAETTRATEAESALQTTVDTNTADISTNKANIEALQNAGYITSDALEPYAKSADVAETYATISSLDEAKTELQSSIDTVGGKLSEYAKDDVVVKSITMGEEVYTPTDGNVELPEVSVEPATTTTEGVVKLATASTITDGAKVGTNSDGQLTADVSALQAEIDNLKGLINDILEEADITLPTVTVGITTTSNSYEFNLWHMMEGDSASSTYTAGNVPQYDFEVDWGDGSDKESYTNSTWKNAIHTYATAGDYTIKVYGTFEYLGLTGYSTSSSPTGQSTMQLIKKIHIAY